MEDPISEEMLEGNMKAGGSYVCDFKDGKYVIEDKAKKSGDEKDVYKRQRLQSPELSVKLNYFS